MEWHHKTVANGITLSGNAVLKSAKADFTNVEINWFEKKQLKKATLTASDKKRLKGVRGLQGGLRGEIRNPPWPPAKTNTNLTLL